MSASPMETCGMPRLLGVVHPQAALDGDDVGRPLERHRRGIARRAGPADGLEEVLEAVRGDDPQHHEVVLRALVDELVLDVEAQEARGARHQRVALAVHHHAALASEADLQLDLVAVRVLAHAAAGGDGLEAHREPGEPGAGGVELRIGVAVGGDGLPVGGPILRLHDHRASADLIHLADCLAHDGSSRLEAVAASVTQEPLTLPSPLRGARVLETLSPQGRGQGEGRFDGPANLGDSPRMKITRALAIPALLFAMSLSGPAAAQDTPRTGGVLKAAMIGEPPTLDLHWTTAVITQENVFHVYEGLFTYDAKFAPVPMLAESSTMTPDGRRYTIALRKGVRFHTGK